MKEIAKVVPDVVIIKTSEERTYVSVLKSLRKGLVDACLSGEVGTVRKTRDGDLLLQLNKQTTKSSKVKLVAESSTGAETYVKALIVAVEIRGLDADVTPEELIFAISEKTKTSVTNENTRALKPGLGGKVVAVVLLPTKIANELARDPRLRLVRCALEYR